MERGRIQGLPQIFWVHPIISRTGKATELRFGRYIYRTNRNKCPLKILEKKERERIQKLPKFFWVPPIISGAGKATDFKRSG